MRGILYAPGLDETELLRSLAKNGINTFGLRVMNDASLASYVLDRTDNELNKTGFLLDKQRCITVIYTLIKDKEKHKAFKYPSYKDAEGIYSTLNSIRLLSVQENQNDPFTDELEMISEFLQNKKYTNIPLYEVFVDYCEYKRENNYLDSIDLLRLATYSEELNLCTIFMLDEIKYMPLQEALVKVAAINVERLSIRELYEVTSTQSSKKINYVKAYGTSNEVEYVLKTIIENNYKLDECLIVAPNLSSYSMSIVNACEKYNLPMLLHSGYKFTSTNAFVFIREFYNLAFQSEFGHDDYKKFINSSFFNKKLLIKKMGIDELSSKCQKEILDKAFYLRIPLKDDDGKSPIDSLSEYIDITISKYEEKIQNEPNNEIKEYYRKTFIKPLEDDKKDLPYLKKMEEEMSIGEDFFDKYIKCNGIVDELGKKYIYHILSVFQEIDDNPSFKEVLGIIIEQLSDVTLGNNNSCPGCLYASDFKHALSSMRKHIFIIGMDSTFPGDPKENFLISDEHYKEHDNAEYAPLSISKIKESKELFLDFLNLARGLDCDIQISTPFYSLTDVRKINASSVLFEIYQKFINSKAEFDDYAEYFKEVRYEDGLDFSSALIKTYNQENTAVEVKELEDKEEQFAIDPNKKFSPSAINNFFDCPRKFYLKNILYMDDSNPIDTFSVLEANEKGTLIHSVLEYWTLSMCKFEELREIIDDLFAMIMHQHIIKQVTDWEPVYQSIRDDIERYVSTTRNLGSYIAEQDVDCLHKESGVWIHGFPDCVELENGELKVLDYKTGKSIHHKKDNIDTCLQTVIYCYILEHLPNITFPVTGSEYRYVCAGRVVPCKYDLEMKDKLTEKLKQLKSALDTGNFPKCSIKKCDENRYCRFKNICGRGYQEEK